MKSKILLVTAFFTLIAILYSCDSREDYYLSIDEMPQIGIKRDIDTGFIAEISDSNKIGSVYNLKVFYKDEETLKLKITKNFTEDSINVIGNNFFFRNNVEGVCTLDFKVVDSYGKKNLAKLKLVSFKNLPPLCDFKINKNSTKDSVLLEINASSSYDLDWKWGGHVVLYRYDINGQVDTTSLSSIKQIYYTKGQKRIGVKVMDNNKCWSEEKAVFITL